MHYSHNTTHTTHQHSLHDYFFTPKLYLALLNSISHPTTTGHRDIHSVSSLLLMSVHESVKCWSVLWHILYCRGDCTHFGYQTLSCPSWASFKRRLTPMTVCGHCMTSFTRGQESSLSRTGSPSGGHLQLLPVGGQDQVYLRVLCSGGVVATRGGEDGGSSNLEVCG